ncbi:MAG TPA: HAD-IIIA family hydrolase [Candidatus Didemnitutus sp.]|nr:HAD-IIIA family hydrolase [Candidatus Didemnitutus sp.]
MNLRPAVFLDRDGTLNVPVVRSGRPFPPALLEEFQLVEGAADTCSRLKAAGFALVVATNQPDVGRGTQAREMVEAMHAKLRSLVPAIDRIEVCYDPGRGEASTRRKPAPGMLLDAAAALSLDLTRSWMVGDRAGDIDAGHAAGCRTIFIDWGYAEPAPKQNPDFIVTSLVEAAGIILPRA